MPLLRTLVTHMAISRKLHAALAGMEAKSLAGTSKAAKETPSIYLQFLMGAREEAKIVSSLATKLRLAPTAAYRKAVPEAEATRARAPAGPRPWEPVERNN